jgi:hypothetical protein
MEEKIDSVEVIRQDHASDDEGAKAVNFVPAPESISVIERNGVEILVPKRSAPRKCTINEILKAVGGDITPSDDFREQSTYGDNSRLARKLGVSVQSVRNWRREHPIIDQAMVEEAERDLDQIENIARSQMMAGDSRVTTLWLTAKGRSRGFGKEQERYQAPAVSNEELNKKIKNLAPRERLRLLAEAHKSGEYEGANASFNGEME